MFDFTPETIREFQWVLGQLIFVILLIPFVGYLIRFFAKAWTVKVNPTDMSSIDVQSRGSHIMVLQRSVKALLWMAGGYLLYLIGHFKMGLATSIFGHPLPAWVYVAWCVVIMFILAVKFSRWMRETHRSDASDLMILPFALCFGISWIHVVGTLVLLFTRHAI